MCDGSATVSVTHVIVPPGVRLWPTPRHTARGRVGSRSTLASLSFATAKVCGICRWDGTVEGVIAEPRYDESAIIGVLALAAVMSVEEGTPNNASKRFELDDDGQVMPDPQADPAKGRFHRQVFR